ncbi:MAG TPA: aspartate ammonia-lyase [Thermoanaerobaculaceae bacterium]|nr:aspartate ammonia-lyase [Thermoanaerobaculaceae bacterium]
MGDETGTRIERDALGELAVPAGALWGIHTARSIVNFPLAGRPVHPELVRAYGAVKLACALTSRALGARPDAARADAIERACREMANGELSAHVVVDSLQGGAGTSLNMNVNEVVANRALVLMGLPPGRYDVVSPLDDVNLHQSTNDTFPTALRLAAIRLLHALEREVLALQEAFQAKEKAFAHVVKVGRTEMQDAVLTTLGREMGGYAEAFNRDRWRIYKCEERLRVVNLGGTAIGSGLAAPREYIFRVVDTLREVTGIGFARAENLQEATANADVFVEVSGIVKACAASLVKVCGDLRLLSSGPEGGLGEIRLPARQAGSSIMPGKVNPVIPEGVTQAALLVMGNDQVVAAAAAAGSLELNPFLPLVAHCLLESLDLLARACRTLRERCVEGIEADEARCRRQIDYSTATVTALVPALGYDGASHLLAYAREHGLSIKEAAIDGGFVTLAQFDELTSPEAVCRLGSPGIKPRS